jgi:chromosome segregation ATPase
MEKQEREELRAVAADGFPISPTRVLDLFADYDALAKSHAHADKHRVALEARLAEVEADLAHCRHTRRLQADARQKERAKLDSLQAQYEDMKQERDMFAEKLAEAEEDRERLEGMTLSSEAAHTYAVELEARLAEAEKDRERLDWLEGHRGSDFPRWSLWIKSDGAVEIGQCNPWGPYDDEAHETLRKAIDAVREGE